MSAGSMQAAEQPSESQILESLGRLRRPLTRSLSVQEREEISEIVRELPSIDVDINFDYASAVIGPRAQSALAAIGRVLRDPEFKDNVLLLAGHTDAKGSERYNQRLSVRRAEAVKRFLVEKFGLAETSLVTVGYGKDGLKNEADPFAAENRRVQVYKFSREPPR